MNAATVSARFAELFPESNLIGLLSRYGGDADDIFEANMTRTSRNRSPAFSGSSPQISIPLPAPPTGS